MANRRHALINRPSGGASAEVNDLTAAVTWANVPDANITQSSVTQHQAALSITESQISDLGAYLLNVVEDLTPQLGGNLDAQSNSINTLANLTMDGELTIQDSTNADTSRLYHDGTNMQWLFTGTTDIRIQDITGEFKIYDGAGVQLATGDNVEFGLSFMPGALTGTSSSIYSSANMNLYAGGGANYIQIINGTVTRFMDSTNADYLQIRDNGSNASITTNTNALQINSGAGLIQFTSGQDVRIYDSVNTDWVSMSHDGTNFLFAGTNTAAFNFSGGTSINLQGAASAFPSYEVGITGTNGYGQYILYSNTVGNSASLGYSGSTSTYYPSSLWLWTDLAEMNLEVDGTSGFVGIRDATALRIYDGTDADYVQFAHDGTDFNTSFVTTADWNVTGLGGADPRLNLEGSITIANPGWYIDRSVDNSGITLYAGRWSTAGNANIELYGVSHAEAGKIYYDAAVHTFRDANAGNTSFRITPASSLIEVRGGDTFRIYDSTNTDYAAFNHDGTNFNTAFTNTGVWSLSGGTALQTISGMDIDIRDNGLLRIRDAGDTDYVEFQHDGTDFRATFTNTDWWRINDITGGIWLMDGKQIRIADATDLDYMRLYHDGTHFYMNAVNTGDIVLRDIQQITFDASSGTAPYNSTYSGIYFLSTGTAAASYYGLHNNFNQSGTGGPTTAYIEMSANGPTYASYAGFRSHIYATTEDNQQTSFAITGDNGAFLNFWVLGGVPDTSIVEVYDGSHLRILNSGGTDYVDFNHDGTNFNADFTNTADWDIDGLADVNLLTGTALKIWDTTNVESFIVSVEPTYSQILSTNHVYLTGGVNFAVLDGTAVNQIRLNATATQTFIESDVGGIRMRPVNGIVDIIRSGGQNYLRVWDSTTTDYCQISETGSNTQISTNNNNIQISTGGGIVELTGGQTFRIRDATNSDNIAISHDGTDVNIVGTNTTDINITGISGGGFVRVGTAPLATATWTNVSEDVSDTCDYQYMNGVYFKDGTTGITLTLEASGVTTFEVGATTNIINAHATTGDITVNEGTGTTLYLCDGSTVTDTAGGCTVGPGGYATLYRHSATVYYIMGAGITA